MTSNLLHNHHIQTPAMWTKSGISFIAIVSYSQCSVIFCTETIQSAKSKALWKTKQLRVGLAQLSNHSALIYRKKKYGLNIRSMFCIKTISLIYVHTIYSVVMVGCVADFYCFRCISPSNYRRQMDSGRQNQNKTQIPKPLHPPKEMLPDLLCEQTLPHNYTVASSNTRKNVGTLGLG